MQGSQHYQSEQQSQELHDLVYEYAPLVKRIANQIKRKIPEGLDVNDLIQSGLIGLLEAKSTYQEEHATSFKTYSTMKIRFAIYDSLRKSSGITREISQNIKRIDASTQHINQEGLNKTDITSILGVSSGQYAVMQNEITAFKMASLDELAINTQFAGDPHEDPLFKVAEEDTKALLKSVLASLPKREQIILSLYYNEFLSFKEIAELLDLTEARISQIHSQMLVKLRSRLTNLHGAFDEVF